MFIQNKYTKIYQSIINRAYTRQLDSYSEKHHIIPKSLGGVDDATNLVILTAREHFICHWLLIKMTTGTELNKMIFALAGMQRENGHQQRYTTKITSRVYANNKISAAILISTNNTGLKRTAEQKKQRSLRNTGTGNPMYGKKQSEITKQKIREARALQDNSHLAGRIITPEWRQKISDTLKNGSSTKGKAKPVHQCIHCGGIYSRSMLNRWHGTNCKKAK